ncbi:MAG TPA: helix-turn-helix domain-containing protein [Solirubrobacteraceae bacterium]|nr:helix-turn-helix domain-containing protein [Solirubrobacteraceae bacterium]
MRTYGDPCGIARALDLVGERWALLVVRELLLGPKRFTDLRAGLPHVGPDMLAQRLRELERSGVVQRAKLPPPAGARVYELTDWGRKLEPVVLALGRWGSQAPFPPERGSLGVDSMVLALKTVFDPAGADGMLGATFELRLGEESFTVRVGDAALEAARGPAADPVATITTEPGVLQDVLWHDRPMRAGGLDIDGDRQAGERFLTLFPIPS